jgi:hypothetical protein
LVDATLMAPAFKRRLQPQRQDLVGKAEGDDAAAHRENVCIVVLARQPRGIEVVAERRPNAGHLVRRNLLTLPAAAKHYAPIGPAFGHRSADAQADRRVVDRRFASRPMIVHGVAKTGQRLFQMFFQQETGVIGADGDTHGLRLYYGASRALEVEP